jgi:hypothetical protein
MNYKKIYDKIIENRLNNPLDETEYGEKHHIIPRSLGGSDEVQNLVRLTAREHFICHALLAEMYEDGKTEWYKMNLAFEMMRFSNTTQLRYINSRLYELKKKDFSKAHSWNQSGERNSQYGKPRPTEVRLKIRKSLKMDKPTKREILDLKRKSQKENRRNYYINLYNDFLQSNLSLTDFHKSIDYSHSLVNLCRSFMKYVDSYEKTQGKSKVKD